MGVDTRRPPLPAPTEDPSSMDNETDLATDISRRTDHTSISIPEDGRPVTIPTARLAPPKDGRLHHSRQKSQTSLLIEYFEGGKKGDKSRSKPSVRVKVTPSSARRSKNSSDAVQITGIGSDRKPSYTRRISLGSKTEGGDKVVIDGTEVSRSTDSNGSAHPPIEVEVINGSDMSTSRNSRDLRYLEHTSDISSMPPDSLLESAQPVTGSVEETVTEETPRPLHRKRSRSLERQTNDTTTEHLEAPGHTRTRSLSRDRITRKVMEKLAGKPVESSGRRGKTVEYEPDTKPAKERRRRSSRSHHQDDIISPESSQLSSGITASQTSYRSGNSKVSLNNPRLLEMVEDTVKRLILPELQQMRTENRTSRNTRDFEDSRRSSAVDRDSYSTDIGRSLSKSSSTPNIRGKPKVVLNRHEDDPGHVLSRGDSEKHRHRRSSRSSTDGHEKRRRRSSRTYSIDEDRETEKKSKGSHRVRDAAAGAIAGGILTAAALKRHNSRDEDHGDRLRDRQERRSRSDSMTESTERMYETEPSGRHRIPFIGGPADSEMTRESIMSASTERPYSYTESEEIETPVRDVKRGSLDNIRSGELSTSTQTPETARNVGEKTSRRSFTETEERPSRSSQSTPSKSRNPTLLGAVAGIGGAAAGYQLGKGKSPKHGKSEVTHGEVSPIQSVSSLRDGLHDPLIPQALRTRSPASTTQDKIRSGTYISSPLSSVGRAPSDGRISPLAPDVDSFAARIERNSLRPSSDSYDDATPRGADMEEWLQEEHETNNKYRDSYTEDSARGSYIDGQTTTGYTDGSFVSSNDNGQAAGQNIHKIGGNPHYVEHPIGVESAVASLIDPSTVSSYQSSGLSGSRPSYTRSVEALKANVTRLDQPSPTAHELEYAQDIPESPASVSKSGPRSNQIYRKPVAQSPRQSEAASLREERSTRDSTPVQLGASGVPLLDDPMPEIGHGLDTTSETNSILSGPRQPMSAKESRERFSARSDSPHKDSRDFSFERNDDASISSRGGGNMKPMTAAAAGLAAGTAAGLAASKRHDSPSVKSLSRQASEASVDDAYERVDDNLLPAAYASPPKPTITPTNAQIQNDEGYVSGAYARSTDTPRAPAAEIEDYSKEDLAEYEAAMGAEDPFMNAKRDSHLSGNSHGMDSPIYDSATGRGINHIQSKDVVALMDHLTVRDGQRNARDTEILVTLVRSAAEMRQNFEEMKRFIAVQDRMIMKNTDRDADMTVQKVLQGQRPQPQQASRPPRPTYDDDSVSSKRKNVFKRALKGLSGRSSNDLANIENMLVQLLEDVEYLKDAQQTQSHQISSPQLTAQSPESSRKDGFSSYEALRANAGSGYEPEGLAGTGSTPNQSGNFQLSPPPKQGFHSGYDGRRDSIHRVSTVMEGDEDDDFGRDEQLTPRPSAAQMNLSPQVDARRNGMMFNTTPTLKGPSVEQSPQNTPERQRKHKSTSSSLFGGAPKVSRWSKTTASSGGDGFDSRRQSREQRPLSDASLSGGSLNPNDDYYEDQSVGSDNRRFSAQSAAYSAAQSDNRSLRSGRSDVTRTPSPLIPSEASGPSQPRSISQEATPSPRLHLPQDEDDDENFGDPKYSAVRDSLLLQHPQPRPGPTQRHQSNLESRAQDFAPSPSLGTESDLSQRSADSEFDPSQWGSNPALSLARAQKLGKINPHPTGRRVSSGSGAQLSPAQSASPVDALPWPRTATAGRRATTSNDDGPLFPIQKPDSSPVRSRYDDDNDDDDARYYAGNNGGRSTQQGGNGRRYERSAAPPRSFDRLTYSSPLGQGHLLEPIQEVRYSLETDGISLSESKIGREMTPSPGPNITPRAAKGAPGGAGDSPGQGQVRKLTGPRPMSGSGRGGSAGWARKVVGGGNCELNGC